MGRVVRMSLPDATRSDRVYPLLQNLDLENLAFATMQGVGNTLAIEEMNEDELRRIVLVNLARLTVSGEWNGLLTAGGGAGAGEMPGGSAGSPAGNSLLVQYPMFYPNSRAETSGNGVVRFNDNQATFYPFWNAKAGTMDTISCRLAATNVDDLIIGLFTSGADGCPNTIVGTQVEWDMGTSGIITLDLSGVGDWAMDADSQYWIGMMLKTDTTNRPTFYIMNTTTGPAFTIPNTGTDTVNYILVNTSFYVGNLTAGTLPSTVPVSAPDGLYSDQGQVPWMSFTLA